MEGHGHSRRRRGDGCTVVECYTPRRVVARWLSGLRSSKGKREAEDDQDDDSRVYHLPPITRPLDEKPKTHRFGNKFVFLFFLPFSTIIDKLCLCRTRKQRSTFGDGDWLFLAVSCCRK